MFFGIFVKVEIRLGLVESCSNLIDRCIDSLWISWYIVRICDQWCCTFLKVTSG